ncbi:serine/threonine-protein kinase HAL4/SAT4 [[Candida] railenensis]|uniref:non-specific serine/threonine protein kinase n=1 Tax=[Candida] railenensis TaxID=45579 RepID=A0A9P0QJ68_9ASCO|nr:serine/threonine-protein kinase HAL4/SAT4 [[Candida] railenensis]
MGDSKPKRSLSKLGKLFSAGIKEEDKDDEVDKKEREERLKAIRKGIVGLHTKDIAHSGTQVGSNSGSSTPTTPSGDNTYLTSPTLSSSSSPLGGRLSPRLSNHERHVNSASGTTNGGSATGSTAVSASQAHPYHPPIRSQPVSRNSSVVRKALNSSGSSGSNTALNSSVSNGANNSSSNNATVSRSSSISKPTIGGHSNLSSTNLGASAPNPNSHINKPRFRMLESGLHEHNLRSAKRQEKLSNMLKDLLGAKKLRDEAKSELPNILNNGTSTVAETTKPPTLFAGLVSQVKNNTSPYHGTVSGNEEDCRSFVEKYGRCQEVIGKGSFGVVRVSHKKANPNSNEEVLFAVKEFKRKPSESDQKYNRRLTSEFCISSSLKHMNIIDTLDLLKDAKGDYCEVMEFCSGGDLYTLIIASGKLEYAEADCFFKQLIRGVNYMHDMGVSHRDLKPENLLLTQRGVLKITDFGNGECFKMAWEKEIQLSEGVCGSSPYIAPEEFTQKVFDPRGVDIWACGVIYMAMRTGRQLWKLADPKKDEFFHEYLLKRKDATGYEPIESLKRARCRNVIYSILDPKPERRINGKQILSSEWGREIKVCAAGDGDESE